jgi:hypothetical protein
MAYAHVPVGATGNFQVYPVAASVVAFLAAEYQLGADSAGRALISVETISIRWRCDGVDPTLTVGILAAAGSTIELNHPADIARFRMTRAEAGTASVTASFSRNDPRG